MWPWSKIKRLETQLRYADEHQMSKILDTRSMIAALREDLARVKEERDELARILSLRDGQP